MSKIKPFWRIVIGFLILMVVVYGSNMMTYNGNFMGFAFPLSCLVVFIYFAIRIPYDDPLRSMRDLLAQQAETKVELPAADGEDTPEIRMIIMAARRMDSAKQKEMLRVLKAVFPEEFGDSR